jgi:RimJ/RimL family protein N-acetyltransferase
MSAPPVVELVYPMPADWVPWLWAWLCESPAVYFDDAGPQTLEAFQATVAQRAVAGERRWGVKVNGIPAGVLAYQPVSRFSGIGHVCFTRTVPTQGVPGIAVRQALDELRREGVRKVCCVFYADNRAIRRFLRTLGAVEEGLLRNQVERGGQLVDLRLMALFLSDGDDHA